MSRINVTLVYGFHYSLLSMPTHYSNGSSEVSAGQLYHLLRTLSVANTDSWNFDSTYSQHANRSSMSMAK